MDHYRHFTIEELVWDEPFRRWVLNPTDEDTARWSSWLEKNPEQALFIERARKMVQAIAPGMTHLPEAEKQDAIRRILQRSGATGKGSLVTTGNPRFRRSWLQIAAAASVIAVIGWQLLAPPRKMPGVRWGLADVAGEQPWIEKQNATAAPLLITLDDGSVISLDPQSKISYPPRFTGGKREVALSGEAFFEVSRDPSRPFLVYANETVTEVLGTSFRVQARNDASNVIVAVHSGRVSVFTKTDYERGPADPKRSGLVLSPNQQAVFAREQAQLTRTLVKTPLVLGHADLRLSFDFDNTPVSEVFRTLSEAYGLEIVYDSELLQGRTLSVSLEDESLYEKLDIICKTLRVTYRIEDARVMIESDTR